MRKQLWKSVTELENRGGELYFDGMSVRQLADEFGTPLYVYSAGRIRNNYWRLVEAYRKIYPHFKIQYAIKANNNPAIIRILAKEGAGADASCIPEIRMARHAGIPSEKILYSGVYNEDGEFRDALEQKVLLNLEDVSHLERLKKLGVPKSLCFRVNPGIGSSGAEGLVFAGPNAKFGIIEEDIEKTYYKAKELGVERFGIHMMTGSNILSPQYFEEVVEKLLDIAGSIAQKLRISFDFIDIGGSLGVAYLPEQEELDIEAVAQSVVGKMREKLRQYGMGEPQLIHEPGRYLVCDAGILISTVSSIKESHKKFIGVDAGMHTLLRPALYEAYHHILYAEDLEAPGDVPVNVVGQVCENTDVLARDRMLPSKITLGDRLVFLNTGAYGFCMSSQYNSRPRAAEVLISKGRVGLIRERETYADLIRGTHVPEDIL